MISVEEAREAVYARFEHIRGSWSNILQEFGIRVDPPHERVPLLLVEDIDTMILAVQAAMPCAFTEAEGSLLLPTYCEAYPNDACLLHGPTEASAAAGGDGMTLDEAAKVLAILKGADGGCRFCAMSQFESFQYAFPQFAIVWDEDETDSWEEAHVVEREEVTA